MSCFKVAWFNHLYYYTWALGASQESPGTVSASVNDDGSLRTLAPPFKGLVAHEPREVKRSSVFCVLVTSLGTIDFYMRRTPDQTSQSKWHTVPTHAQSIRPVHCTPPSLHALLDTVPIEVFLGCSTSLGSLCPGAFLQSPRAPRRLPRRARRSSSPLVMSTAVEPPSSSLSADGGAMSHGDVSVF